MSAGQAAGSAPLTGYDAAQSAVDPLLRRTLGWMVVLITCGYTFLDYWNYSRTDHEGGGASWQAALTGHAFAPEQYRIGVLHTADLLARLSHTHLRHMFAAIDFVCLVISLWVLLRLLARMEIFRGAGRMGQWLQASLALGCFLLYLLWTFWYQKPETHATLLLLTLSAAAARWSRRLPAATALIILAAAGATVRADAVLAFHAGFVAACLLPQARSLQLGRRVQMTTSLLAIAAAAGVEYIVMYRIYPGAPREVSAFQLVSNLKEWLNYIVVGLALFPWWATLRFAAHRWKKLDGWSVGLLLGSVVHFVFFCTLGIAWEVRIFLPFAMAVVPLTVTLTYAGIETRGRAEAAR